MDKESWIWALAQAPSRAFARSGAKVTAIDISASQISAARKLAEQEHLDIEFFAGAAEDVDFDDCSFEVVTAGQAWTYFNRALVIPKVLRLLVRNSYLALTHVQWLPKKDDIAKKTEDLILEYNPEWTGGGYKGDIRPMLKSVREDLISRHSM